MSIVTHNLTKKFGKLTAVNSVSLKVEKGEIFGLLGPNGAGKTTLLSMLAVLLAPTSGTATVNGHDITKESLAVRKEIGMVFQSASLDGLLTARENLQLHSMLYGVPQNVRNGRIDEVLEWVELSERQNDLVNTYSGGMKKRLEIARGLLHRPSVLFLDEPTVGLDPQNREHIWTYVRKLAKQEEMTIILTTHYMEEADMLANRVALIDRGKIMELDTPSALKKKIGGDKVTIKCREACSISQMKKIRAMPFVRSISQEKGHLALVVENAPKHLQPILDAAGKVDEVNVSPASLNDVFLKFTGHALREESPEDDSQAMALASTRR